MSVVLPSGSQFLGLQQTARSASRESQLYRLLDPLPITKIIVAES